MPSARPLAEIPVIVTPRLRLRAHGPGDLAACTAMWADPDVTRHTGGRPFSREESWARMLRYAGHWAWFGHGFWAIDDRDDDRFVGEVGFANFERDLGPVDQRGAKPSLADVPELGWALVAAAHGKGFASEAVRAALAWGDANLGVPATACIIDPGNTASIRVALRCGFAEIGRATYKGGPTIMFERRVP